MTAISKAANKAHFKTGDRPSQADFSDLIDSYQDYSDVLTAIAVSASAGNKGIPLILSASAASLVSAGTAGLGILATVTTAQAQSAMGGGAVGRQIFEAVTTAGAAAIIGAGDMTKAVYDAANISEQVIGVSAAQTLYNKTLQQPILVLAQSASPTPTTDGDIRWDSDDNHIVVGNGTNQTIFYSGGIIDRAYAEYTTNAALTTAIPIDDTIPQNTEGTQILSATITPKTTTNRLRVTFCGQFSHNANMSYAVAIFRNSDANAIDAKYGSCLANYGVTTTSQIEFVPGSTSLQTINVRVGPQATGQIQLNGITTRLFGGVSRATLIIEEIVA